MLYYPASFVAIDFETAYSQRHSVCAVGLVKFIDQNPVAEYYNLVQPPWDSIPESSVNNRMVHGIYDWQLLGQPFWPEIHTKMEEFCEGLPLVAHNASFEKSCIKKCNEHYNITSTTLLYENMYDTYVITKEIEGLFNIKLSGPGARRLNTLCEMYGCPMEGIHHNALDDAYACGNLLIKFNQYQNMTTDELISQNITVPEPIIEVYKVPGTVETVDELFSEL